MIRMPRCAERPFLKADIATIRVLASLGVIAISFGLASCASTVLQAYEGSARPDDETALITTRRASTQTLGNRVGRADIVSIQLPHGTLPTNSRSARVLPGETCIGVRARSATVASVTAELCFFAYARSVYEIRVSVSGRQQELTEDSGDDQRTVETAPSTVTRIWIEDAATSEVVAVFTP